MILLVGLQGSGKTTTAAKLALHLKKKLGKQVLLVPADVYRPAATEQLRTLAKENGLPCFDPKGETNAVARVKAAVKEAKLFGWDVAIVDTAGRLHVDDALMDEVARIREACEPDEILFVADAMTGQDAVLSARAFSERLPLTGVILTKLDGDARGGAALSLATVVGRPIKFAGIGEKTADLEPFHPDRAASRILGMGDVMTLIEKVSSEADQKAAQRAVDRLRKNEFTLDDLRDHFRQLKRLGPLSTLVGTPPEGRAVQAAPRPPDRGRRHEAPRGDDRLDDRRGAERPEAPQREPKAPRRARLGDLGPGHQPAPEAVPRDEED